VKADLWRRVVIWKNFKDLMPCGNHVPEGEILKAFQSVNG
jgi:hypothetical protein